MSANGTKQTSIPLLNTPLSGVKRTERNRQGSLSRPVRKGVSRAKRCHGAGRVERSLPRSDYHRSSWSWLDWDRAVSILSQDNEIKQTYLALIASDNRPAVFLDVGANYGIHSILFLSAGIPVIAFEPNPSCFRHFQTICKLNAIRKSNGFAVQWEQAAIGNETGLTELVYFEKDTWLGSVAADVQSVMRKWGDVITLQVPLKKLDDF
jgi:FkbM family methyltransferase